MHGAACANYAVRDCDLLIALGHFRFDDRVTGKVEAFAEDAKIIHVDIDDSELNKEQAHIPVRGDVKDVLRELNKIMRLLRSQIGKSSLQRSQGKVSAQVRSRLRRYFAATHDPNTQRYHCRYGHLRFRGCGTAPDVGSSIL